MRNFNEKKLVFKLDKILKREFGTNLAFHEFSAGYGIADLVFASNFSFSKRVNQRTPLTNFNSLSIFLALDNQRIYELADLLAVFPHLNSAEIKNQLRALLKEGYLEKVGEGGYRKIIEEDEFNPIQKIVAVEVKLNDHKGGLVQARRYQYFADESYLAILKSAKKNINTDEFNHYNIGLILFDNETNTVEIKHPESNNGVIESSVNLFAKEMMMSQYLLF